MTSIALALRLRAAGLDWEPSPGDRFVIPDRGMDDEVFVLSTMTVDVHEFHGQKVIGFNGTTEWALDDVEKDATIWIPREDQLRAELGRAFQRLEQDDDGWTVVLTIWAETVVVRGADPEEAYGAAVLQLLTAGPVVPGV